MPAERYVLPFSDVFEIWQDKLRFNPAQTASLASHLLDTQPEYIPLVIDFPETISEPDWTFLDAVQNQLDVQGQHVVVGLDLPGVTSYVMHSSQQAPVGTTALQLHAIQQIRQGNYYVIKPIWLIGGLFLLALAPLALGFWPKWRLWAGLLSAGLVGAVLLMLPVLGVFLPSVWTGMLLIPLGWLAYVGWTHINKPAQPVKEGAPREVPTPDTSELDALRYKLRFYENLEQQATLENEPSDVGSLPILHHEKSPLVSILRKAGGVATSDVPVLILGDSGTGKEMLAQYIHAHSSRATAPFVAVNCASLNENLIESELFGHEAGAFTGATHQKIGRFERADGGTLFLDEIAETSLAFQVKLLRVLQEGIFERVGGTEAISVSVRIIAATLQDLRAKVERGDFREDLYYRLNGFSLVLPPLKDRPDDVEYLFRAFLHQQNPALQFSSSLIDWLKLQPWKGNVRELKAATERAVLNAQMQSRSFLLPRDFELIDPVAFEAQASLADQVLEALRADGFQHRSISHVADQLGLHRVTVTEYFRGWVIRSMAEHGSQSEPVCRALQGPSVVHDQAQFQARIERYMQTIEERIEAGFNAGETDSEIRLGRFKHTQQAFEEDLEQLIQHMRRAERV